MTTPLQHEDELAQSGIFSLEDLEINRAGQLSDQQKRKLKLQMSSWLGLTVLYVILMIAFITILVATQANLLLGLAGLTFMLVVISSSLEHARPFRDDLQTDTVKTASGPLHKGYGITQGTGRSWIVHCNLRVNDQTFPISPAIYECVHEGEPYRIYYVENTRTIVNIEPL